MIKTYIRVELSSEGESPRQVIERMRRIGAVPVVGDYDFEMNIGDDERIFDKLEEIHKVLKGSNVRYVITTRTDVEAEQASRNRQLVAHYVDQRPVELKKTIYKAKLERWKSMGLEVSELEKLLDTDLERFKTASKEFLRTHLDHMSVVKGSRADDNQADGQVLELLDEEGKSLMDLMSATGYSEEQILISLGRLISSGSAARATRSGSEVYTMVLPSAPSATRRATVVIPAKDYSEAEERVLGCILPEGIGAKDLARAARLPREQLAKAMGSLTSSGKVIVSHKGKQEFYQKV